LNIEKQILENHHAQLTVQVESDRLENAKHRAASQLAKRVKIAGFRPGKAPYPVIVRQLGEAAILEEAIELLVDEIYPEVLKEADIKPYGPGKLENISNADPLTIEFSIPLEAEATLGDYHSIQKPYEPEVVSDQDVTDVLQNLLERNAVIEPVDRPTQEGDLVTLNLSATRLVEDGQTEELIPERATSVIIRPITESTTSDEAGDAPNEWPFPDFSRNLIGLSASDEKSLEYTFPEDSDYSTLKGAVAKFQIKVESVKSRTLPDLDDEFAKTIGEYETMIALQEDIRQSLEAQARSSYNESYDDEILDAAVEQTIYKYPPEMVDHEIETVISEFQRRLERQGMELSLYLKSRGIDMDTFKEEVKPVAEGRIKRALFLVEFGRAENIEVKSEELEKEAFSAMDYLYNTLPERDTRKLSQRDVYTNIIGNVLADMLSRRSLERFRELCSGGLSKMAGEEETHHDEPATGSELVAETVEAELVASDKVETDVLPSLVESELATDSAVNDATS
jgi:trigger factor